MSTTTTTTTPDAQLSLIPSLVTSTVAQHLEANLPGLVNAAVAALLPAAPAPAPAAAAAAAVIESAAATEPLSALPALVLNLVKQHLEVNLPILVNAAVAKLIAKLPPAEAAPLTACLSCCLVPSVAK